MPKRTHTQTGITDPESKQEKPCKKQNKPTKKQNKPSKPSKPSKKSKSSKSSPFEYYFQPNQLIDSDNSDESTIQEPSIERISNEAVLEEVVQKEFGHEDFLPDYCVNNPFGIPVEPQLRDYPELPNRNSLNAPEQTILGFLRSLTPSPVYQAQVAAWQVRVEMPFNPYSAELLPEGMYLGGSPTFGIFADSPYSTFKTFGQQ